MPQDNNSRYQKRKEQLKQIMIDKEIQIGKKKT